MGCHASSLSNDAKEELCHWMTFLKSVRDKNVAAYVAAAIELTKFPSWRSLRESSDSSSRIAITTHLHDLQIKSKKSFPIEDAVDTFVLIQAKRNTKKIDNETAVNAIIHDVLVYIEKEHNQEQQKQEQQEQKQKMFDNQLEDLQTRLRLLKH
jgi:hypothetical protein